ncbi:MAG: YigZ family protein [Eubacteriales bacterium]|nr:YigZ family protein [Eubacteriales bacterium]
MKRKVYKNGQAELVEKKSRFIAYVFAVRHEEEAQTILAAHRKEYWDARHHCYAYILDGANPVMRFSDDGEPSGTAGKPILEVMQHAEVENTLVIVTRYFGGVLLGAGGLVRAYTKATVLGLEAAVLATVAEGRSGLLVCDYEQSGKLQYHLAEQQIQITDTEYGQEVTYHLLFLPDQEEGLHALVAELTGGSRSIQEEKDCRFLELSDGSRIVEEGEK